MKTLLISLVLLSISHIAGAQIQKKSTCNAIKRDDISITDRFWNEIKEIYQNLNPDTSKVNLVCVEIRGGHPNLILEKIEIGENIVVEVIDGQVIGKSSYVCDFFIKTNISTLINGIEKGHYSIICPNYSSEVSSYFYFIIKDGELIFSLFSSLIDLEKTPRLDKALFVNAATLFESIHELKKY